MPPGSHLGCGPPGSSARTRHPRLSLLRWGTIKRAAHFFTAHLPLGYTARLSCGSQHSPAAGWAVYREQALGVLSSLQGASVRL